jgi:hypothetical protein
MPKSVWSLWSDSSVFRSVIMRISLTLILVACFASACAGSSRPAEAPGKGSPPPSAVPEAKPAAPAEASKPTLESQRDPFMQACMSKAHLPDYCECAFEQFRQVFKDADLGRPLQEGDPRPKAVQEKTIALCASKLNEEQVKANFLESCAAGDKRKTKYCNCAWPALRQHLTLADFIGDGETPRFSEAKKSMVVVCKGKFPNDVAKSEFMTGCTKDHPEREGICTCLWKKVKAKVSAEELAAGTIDVQAIPGLAECNK